MKPKRPVPTDHELEILKVIWRLGHGTVREVHQDLSQYRKIAYTTVLTMMGILEQKGHLKKVAGDRAYVYSPVKSKEHVRQTMIDEFVTRVFNGSASALLVHLVDTPGVNAEDLQEIEALLKKRRKRP